MSKGSNAAKKGSNEVGFQPTDKTKLAGKTPPTAAPASPSPWTKDDKLPIEYPTSNVVAAYNSILGENSGRPTLPTDLLDRAKDYGINAEHLWLHKVTEVRLEEAVDMLDEAVSTYDAAKAKPTTGETFLDDAAVLAAEGRWREEIVEGAGTLWPNIDDPDLKEVLKGFAQGEGSPSLVASLKAICPETPLS